MNVIEHLKGHLKRTADSLKIHSQQMEVVVKPLTSEQAIGRPGRDDFPLLKGKERMIEATFSGCRGQSFTDAYSSFTGNVSDFLALDLNDRFKMSWFAAGMNAIFAKAGLIKGTVHCRDKEPEECAAELVKKLKTEHKGVRAVTLIGYQPAMAHHLTRDYDLTIVDLDPDNIGRERARTIVLDGRGKIPKKAVSSDLILATGSSLSNGTFQGILEKFPPGKLIFFGVTVAAAAHVLGLNRYCPRSH